MLKGEKNIPKKQMLVIFIISSYIIIIFDVALLNRGVYTRQVNLNLFSSYRRVWDSFNAADRYHIILNILMTVPLGLMLPVLHNKFHKVRWTIAAGIIFVVIIEYIQLAANSGVFDVDDIFNNCMGILIGYGITMSILAIIERRNRLVLKILAYMLPLLSITITFAGMAINYNTREFGNFNLFGYGKINMSNIEVKLKTELSTEEKTVTVYKAPNIDKNTARNFAENFFKNINIDSTDLKEDLYTDFANYWTRDNKHLLKINFSDGSYEYNNFLEFDKTKYISMDEKALSDELRNYNIEIPKEATFTPPNGSNNYIWKINQHSYEDLLIDGKLLCLCYNDGTIRMIINSIITYSKVRDVYAISEKKAYEKILEGEVNLPVSGDEINSIEVSGVIMGYKIDTKGFYRPVYIFNCKINGEKSEIVVEI
jgi:glycopeptide antibiotics resistance protein